MANKQFFKAFHLPASEPQSGKKFPWWWVSMGVGVVFLSCLVSFWWFADTPLISPLSPNGTFHFLSSIVHKPKPPIVYGFLPYWNLQKITIQPELTHLAYFGLTVGPTGQIVTQTDEGTEPGYSKLQSDQWQILADQMKAKNGKIEIVIAQFSADAITSLLSSEAAHEKFLNSLDSIMLAYPVSGINIDLEYNGEVTPKLRDAHTAFIRKLRQHLNQKYRNVKLSIDVYASAAAEPQLWDIPALAKEVDYFVVMAYDFHRRSSQQAGPVAPLFGGNELWSQDINHYLKSFLSVVSNQQILLGVPFYGYEWQTTSLTAQAQTFPGTGATASYERVQSILADAKKLKATEHWHETALAPYITYTEDGKNYVLYYENAKSLEYKLEYVRQLDLAGIAIWALGYETDSRDLWEPIKNTSVLH
jgi:spore germination protein YaaH